MVAGKGLRGRLHQAYDMSDDRRSRWEYFVLRIPAMNSAFLSEMNRLGESGWEAFGIDGQAAYLKRRVLRSDGARISNDNADAD